jgi:hypothetical protein
MKKIATAEGYAFVNQNGIAVVQIVTGKKESNADKCWLQIKYSNAKETSLVGPYNSEADAESALNVLMSTGPVLASN